MELVSNNGLKVLVDADTYQFGQVTEADVANFEFDFKGSKDQIDYIEKGCACTNAWYEDGKIKGTLTMSKVQKFEPGETAVSKQFFVWLNDGHSRFIGDERKVRQLNPKKTFFRLHLSGMVIK